MFSYVRPCRGLYSPFVYLLVKVKYHTTVPATGPQVLECLKSIMEQSAVESYEQLVNSVAVDSRFSCFYSNYNYALRSRHVAIAV